jgi:hypothetical protein
MRMAFRQLDVLIQWRAARLTPVAFPAASRPADQ